jgi:YbbR domain-containing protein
MLHNKTFTKIISVVIALVLWVYVVGEINPTVTKTLDNIPVKLLNTENHVSKGLVALNSTDIYVSLTVEGKRADILGLNSSNILVTADLFGYYGLGENYINVNVELPNGITLVESKPSKVKVNIDELVTESKPVKINFTGALKEGIEPGQRTMKPESIEIYGARSIVDQVSYIGSEVATSKLSTEITTLKVKAFPFNAAGEVVENVKLATDTIEVTTKLMSTKVVQLSVGVIGQESPDLQITSFEIPNTVKIRGDQEAIDLIEGVSAKEIDLNEYKTSAEIPLEVFLPEGVELADASQSLFAKLVIKGLSSKSFEYNTSVIKIQGLETGFTAEIVPSNLIVSVADKDNVLSEINSTDVLITIDLQNLGVGTHQVAVIASINDSSKNITIGPTEVSVIIKETQQ